jgi:hypothetical protein
MNLYQIFCNIRPGVKNLAFCEAVHAYLGYLNSAI